MSERSEIGDQRDVGPSLYRPAARLLGLLALVLGLMTCTVVAAAALAAESSPGTVIAPASSPSVIGEWDTSTPARSR